MLICVFFFFKQKTAYEMRISDWSSDVCSSDLRPIYVAEQTYRERRHRLDPLELPLVYNADRFTRGLVTVLVPFIVLGNLVADVAQRLSRLPPQPEKGPYPLVSPTAHPQDTPSPRFLVKHHLYLLPSPLRVFPAVFK